MPIYEYHCPKCNAKRQDFRSVENREAPVMCRTEQCGTYMTLMSAPRPSGPRCHVDARVPVRNVFKKIGG